MLALSEKSRNRYHNLTAKFRMANIAERERDYEGPVRIAREACEQARREGMPVVAAQALGELGYGFLYLKRPEQAEPILRKAVEMAERAKATGVLASNRMRLGEVLGALRRPDEAVVVMEPAMRWLRQSGSRVTLPLVLIKWGTVLSSTPRFGEAEVAYREALDLASKDGNALYESMALDRLGAFLAQRDLVKAAEYRERAVALGRQTRLTRVFFLGAMAWADIGRFEQAERLLAEGESAIRQYPAGIDRTEFEALALGVRAHVAYLRGQCGVAESFAAKAMKLTPARQGGYHLLRPCSTDPARLRQSLAWIESDLAKTPEGFVQARWGAAAGAMSLGLKDWRAATAHAARGLEASNQLGLRAYALETSLVLRAVARALDTAGEADRLTAQCLDLARHLGFDPPGAFGGRQDLRRLWKAGE